VVLHCLCVDSNVPLVASPQILNRGSMTCIAMGLTGVASFIRVFGDERVQYWREASGLPQPWHTIAYFFGKDLSMIPQILLAPLVYCIVYLSITSPKCDCSCLLHSRTIVFKRLFVCCPRCVVQGPYRHVLLGTCQRLLHCRWLRVPGFSGRPSCTGPIGRRCHDFRKLHVCWWCTRAQTALGGPFSVAF
jgi:ABC-2 type transporter